MRIEKKLDGSSLSVVLTGRLDTVTSPELSDALSDLSGINALVLDFTAVDYISSAGLRVLLALHKKVAAEGGCMEITNAAEGVMEIFRMTGLVSVFSIKSQGSAE
jgi:anti-anti-sigma factor